MQPLCQRLSTPDAEALLRASSRLRKVPGPTARGEPVPGLPRGSLLRCRGPAAFWESCRTGCPGLGSSKRLSSGTEHTRPCLHSCPVKPWHPAGLANCPADRALEFPLLSEGPEQTCDVVSPISDVSPDHLQTHPASAGHGLPLCRPGRDAVGQVGVCSGSGRVAAHLPGGVRGTAIHGGERCLFLGARAFPPPPLRGTSCRCPEPKSCPWRAWGFYTLASTVPFLARSSLVPSSTRCPRFPLCMVHFTMLDGCCGSSSFSLSLAVPACRVAFL